MDVRSWFGSNLQGLVAWWQSLRAEDQLQVWLATGLVCLAIWSFLAYGVLRRLAGQRRFGGRWYDETAYARLMQVLWEDQQSGLRVMSRSELKALREFKYGGTVKPILNGKGGGYFDD